MNLKIKNREFFLIKTSRLKARTKLKLLIENLLRTFDVKDLRSRPIIKNLKLFLKVCLILSNNLK